MGHVMAFMKKDWTHQGIAKLYSRFEYEGFKMIYITARPLSQVYYIHLFKKKLIFLLTNKIKKYKSTFTL